MSSAQSANEMFRIFSQFNPIFFRAKVKNAVTEYQSHLLKKVKSDIENLRNKFLQSYRNSHVSKLCEVRDIPPVGGQVIWTEQIKNKLEMYMNRVEYIFGSDWQNNHEGKLNYALSICHPDGDAVI